MDACRFILFTESRELCLSSVVECVGVVGLLPRLQSWVSALLSYERLGWHESTVSRRDVREDLITRLTRSSSQATDRNHDVPVDNLDTFSVKPTRKLRMH